MVAVYILYCCLIRTKPCKYFQLNSPWFNDKRGIFSKMDIDRLIPEKWRLEQRYDDGQWVPHRFPVFVKPEWGENAAGIYRADNLKQLQAVREKIRDSRVPYLVQLGSTAHREFEIFTLRHHRDQDTWSVLSITEACNSSEKNPINGIYNPDTRYQDTTDQFTEKQKRVLWKYIERIGKFGIARLSVRADSIEQLLAEDFQVIELNLFTPMPIHLLDKKYSIRDKAGMVRDYMMKLARLTRARDKGREEKAVYTKLMLYNRRSPLANFIREKI